MPDNLLDKIKKTLEEGYDNVRDSATIVLDKAEDFGKVSKLKFEMKQISVQVEKKLTVLGDAVFPFLEKAKIEKLKDNPAIISIVKDIKNLNYLLPVIILIDDFAEVKLDDLFEVGVSDYVKKPYDLEAVVKQIKKLIFMAA